MFRALWTVFGQHDVYLQLDTIRSEQEREQTERPGSTKRGTDTTAPHMNKASKTIEIKPSVPFMLAMD
jgi:hypothetical protein